MKHLQESKSLAMSQILWALVESFLQCVQNKLCCEIAEVAYVRTLTPSSFESPFKSRSNAIQPQCELFLDY
jgi:hypothetical protein